MKFFEDIKPGDRRALGSHTFNAEEIKAFARKYDPQPFHIDEVAAAKSHFGKLCASGWQTAAVSMRLNVDALKREDDERRARGEPVAKSGPSPGVRDLRWLKPVYVGDTISFAAEVLETRTVSRPGYGLITTGTVGTNQHGDVVYSAQGAVFVERRNK
jgi:acyl dehydratase